MYHGYQCKLENERQGFKPDGSVAASQVQALVEHKFHRRKSEPKIPSLIIHGLLASLLPHQERGVRFMVRRENGRKYVRGGLIADELGLGKTVQTIALILHSSASLPRSSNTTLIVTSLTALDEWNREIAEKAPQLQVVTYQGPNRSKMVTAWKSCDVLLTTYDVVRRDHITMGPLYERIWHRIVADEAHLFRNPSKKLCAAMADLRSIGRRWALTATPLFTSPADLYAIFKFLEVPNCDTFSLFTASYISGSHLQFLKNQLRAIMLRRTSRVLAPALPKLVVQPIEMRLGYAKNASDSVYGHSSKCEFVVNAKVSEVRRIILETGRPRKTVLFASFLRTLAACQLMLASEGVSYLQYDGSLSAERRYKVLAGFKSKDHAVLLCSIKTACLSLDLSSASQLIIIDQEWTPDTVYRAMKRVHRLGQLDDVECYQLFFSTAEEDHLLRAREKKQHLMNNAMRTIEVTPR